MQTVGIVNKSSTKLVTKLKHIDIHQHWLRQEAEAGSIVVKWVPTTEMKADGFTKSLGPQKHTEFVRQMNLINIKDQIDKEATNDTIWVVLWPYIPFVLLLQLKPSYNSSKAV